MSIHNKRPTGDIENENTRLHIESVQEEAIGNPIILSAAPTATAPLLSANEVGQNGSDIFIRVGQKLFKLTAADVIDIT